MKTIAYERDDFSIAVQIADDLMLGPFKGRTASHFAQQNFRYNQVLVEDGAVADVVAYLREKGATNIKIS